LLQKLIIEAYSTIDEQAHITGVALIPRISRNNNLYTKAELQRFDNVKVPLNWEHNRQKQIGFVTFHYNEELETVYYEGMITDESAANLARNKTLFTSIEADPSDMKEICNAPDDCFHMPFGLVPKALALTETPGIPETSVQVIEHYIKQIKECQIDKELEAKYGKKEDKHQGECPEGQHMVDGKCVVRSNEQSKGKPNDDCISRKVSIIKGEHPDMSSDQAVAIAISKCSEKEVKEYLMDVVFKVEEYCPHCVVSNW